MRTMAVLFLMLASCATAIGQNDESQKSRIIALENAWNLAEEKKDSKALDALLSNNLLYVDYDGSTLDKEHFLGNVRKPTLQPQQIVNEAMTVNVYGSAAVVTGTYREKGSINGKPFIRRTRFTDTWILDKGAWQCVAGQLTLVSH
jgi:ketosteroid isomerase-like protein